MANETTENELNQTGEPGTEYFMETLTCQARLLHLAFTVLVKSFAMVRHVKISL